MAFIQINTIADTKRFVNTDHIIKVLFSETGSGTFKFSVGLAISGQEETEMMLFTGPKQALDFLASIGIESMV